MTEAEQTSQRFGSRSRRRSHNSILAVVPVNCRFDHMAVNQRLRALLDIADIDIIASYPHAFPADVAARARIYSVPGARRSMPATVKLPLFAAEVALWAAAQRLVRRRYEIVYTFQDASAIAGWLLGPMAGRWAMDVLDDPAQSHGNADQRGERLKSWFLRLYEQIIGFLLRSAGIVFTIGIARDDPLPTALAKVYRVDSQRIVPLRQSVDLALVRETVRSVTGVASAAPRISFVGYVSRLRGVDTLLEAAVILRDRGLNVEVVLVGHLNKKDEEWLRKSGRGLPALQYHGVLPSSDALRVMSTVTLGILPFPDRRETSPVQAVTGIEYLALGKPIVATDLPGARALVDHCKNGMLVPAGDAQAMADAIDSIVTSPGLAKEMGEMSLLKAEMFDAAIIRKEVIHALNSSWR